MTRDMVKFSFPPEWKKRKEAGLCPSCGKTKSEFEKNRKVYCSEECSNKYLDYYQTWQGLRDEFLEEHGESCDRCGVNKEKLKEQEIKRIEKIKKEVLEKYKEEIEAEKFKLLAEAEKNFLKEIEEINNVDFDNNYRWKYFLEDKAGGWNVLHEKSVQFEVDHKIAVINGGDSWDKNNLQVLCDKCHKEKTREDMLERKRRKIKTPKLTQNKDNRKIR